MKKNINIRILKLKTKIKINLRIILNLIFKFIFPLFAVWMFVYFILGMRILDRLINENFSFIESFYIALFLLTVYSIIHIQLDFINNIYPVNEKKAEIIKSIAVKKNKLKFANIIKNKNITIKKNKRRVINVIKKGRNKNKRK
jgi:hypothetical protein